jgi:predicted RNA-binding protein with PUA-like domain
MPRAHWLVKSEPSVYSWRDFAADGSTCWDGVRNYQARNNLRAMEPGDLALFYHTDEERVVVGIARVTRSAYPDPTTDDERWLVVDLEAVKPLERPVALAQIKRDDELRDVALLRQSRLSVLPLSKAEFERILALGETSRVAR